MSYQSTVRKAVTTFAAGACAAFFATTSPAHAQMVLGSSPAPQTSASQASDVTTSRRLVLHDVSVSGRHLAISPDSRPVLDYAVKLLREQPATFVNVSSQGDRPAQRRETQAVAHYLEQRGIPADRVVTQKAAVASAVPESGAGVVVLNISTAS